MVLKNWTQKKGVCTSALDSFLKMVDLERCGVLFLCGFSAYFLRKNRIFLCKNISIGGMRNVIYRWNSWKNLNKRRCVKGSACVSVSDDSRNQGKVTTWRGLWFLRKKISPRATPKASFFDTPLPCHFSAGIWKLKILDFVRQTCNYLCLSELSDNLWSCIGMIWTGKNRAENKHSTSVYFTAYTYILTRKRKLLRYA